MTLQQRLEAQTELFSIIFDEVRDGATKDFRFKLSNWVDELSDTQLLNELDERKQQQH